MIVVMLVSLFTTRIILEILGVDNYGIYNVIGGVVVLFAFINNALTGATQRYLSFALGKNDTYLFNRYYTASFISFCSITLIIIVLAETIGYWFINNKLNIPYSRIHAANIVYQLSIISFVISILRIPFEASVIAYERMSLYAYNSVIEVLLKLGVLYLLLVLPGDKLVNFSVLMLFPPIAIFISFAIFCHKKLSIRFIKSYEKELLIDILSFSGWTLLGSFANVLTRQGGNILINIFFGVSANAAIGIANQVSSSVTSFIGGFQTAFQPQIIKLYASKQKTELDKLIFRTSSWSYYLMLVLVVPIALNINDILHIWLIKVPDFTNIFIICLFIYYLIDAIQAPIIMNITATANIKVYELWLSAILIFNLPISYVLFRLNFPSYALFIVYIAINFLTAVIRTFYAKSFVDFPAKTYLIKIVVPAVIVTIISLFVAFLIKMSMPIFKYSFIISIILIFIVTVNIILFIGFDKAERGIVLKAIASAIKNKLNLKH